MGCLQSKCLRTGCSAEQPGLLYAARGSEGSSTQLCSKRAVISGKGITIFSNRAPSNYQILQKHLDVGICGFHPLGTFHCRHDDPAVDTGRWYANYGSVFMMKSLCKTSPTQFSPLYTKWDLWHRLLPVQQRYSGCGVCSPWTKHLASFAHLNKALPNMQAVLALGPVMQFGECSVDLGAMYFLQHWHLYALDNLVK